MQLLQALYIHDTYVMTQLRNIRVNPLYSNQWFKLTKNKYGMYNTSNNIHPLILTIAKVIEAASRSK